MTDSFIELIYLKEEGSPYIIVKSLARTYYEKQVYLGDDYIFESFMNAGLRIYANDNFLNEEQMEEVIIYFSDNLPMIVLCIYIQSIIDNKKKLGALIFNKDIVYNLIIKGHNEVVYETGCFDDVLNDDKFTRLMNILIQ